MPREYIPAVGQGVREAMATGGDSGIPIVDMKAALVDGSFHDVDSIRNGLQDRWFDGTEGWCPAWCASVLEPVMKVEVTTPEEFMGDVIGNLNARRGRIQGMEVRSGAQVDTGLRSVGQHVRLYH